MEPGGLLMCSQESATEPYFKPDKSNLQPYMPFL
jgi:hypothetical protein